MNDMNKLQKLLKVNEAARYLAISPRTLWGLTKDGKIPAVRFNRSVRYDVRDLDEFIERMKGGDS